MNSAQKTRGPSFALEHVPGASIINYIQKGGPEGVCFLCSATCSSQSRRCKSCSEKFKVEIRNLRICDMESYYVPTSRVAGWKNSKIRDFCRDWNKDLPKVCQNCKYDKHVEFCHIKAIKDFDETSTIGEINSPLNVIMLCPNCHWEFDNGLLNISGNGGA